jgi:hypothetical protein
MKPHTDKIKRTKGVQGVEPRSRASAEFPRLRGEKERIPTVFPSAEENFPRGIEIHPNLENAHCQHFNSVIHDGRPIYAITDLDIAPEGGEPRL